MPILVFVYAHGCRQLVIVSDMEEQPLVTHRAVLPFCKAIGRYVLGTGIDVMSGHMKHCRTAYGISR